MCCNQRYEHMSNYVRYYFYMISRRLFIMKEVIHTSNAPAAIGPYSQAIKAGGAIYVSGQLPVDPATGAFAGDTIQEQTRQSLTNIKNILAEAGTDLDHVVRVDVFMKDDTHLYNNDLYLVNEFRNRIKLKFGKKVFGQVIMQMYNTVIKYGSDLENGNGYKIKFNKPFKITKLSKFIRPYLTEMYVVADKNFNENHELFTRYANGKFLIVDEDLNSGATLANAIHALQNVMPTQKQNNIMCLTNAYSSGGR